MEIFVVESSKQIQHSRHTVSARFSKQCSGDKFRYAFLPSNPIINVNKKYLEKRYSAALKY